MQVTTLPFGFAKNVTVAKEASISLLTVDLPNMEFELTPSNSGSWSVAPGALDNIIDDDPATQATRGTVGVNSTGYTAIDLVVPWFVREIEYKVDVITGSHYRFGVYVSYDGTTWLPVYYTTTVGLKEGTVAVNRLCRYVRFACGRGGAAGSNHFDIYHLAVHGVVPGVV